MVLRNGSNSISTTVILVTFCLVLAAFIATELLDPPQPQVSPVAPSDQSLAERLDVQPFKPLEMPPLDHYDEIIERPLFLDTRRPPPPETEEVAQEEEEPVEEKIFTLLGVMVTPDSKMALVEVDELGSVARLKVGDDIEGWQLDSVSPNNIVLRKGESVKNLPLERNKPPSPIKEAHRRAIEARKRAALRRQSRQLTRNRGQREERKPQTEENRNNNQNASNAVTSKKVLNK